MGSSGPFLQSSMATAHSLYSCCSWEVSIRYGLSVFICMFPDVRLSLMCWGFFPLYGEKGRAIAPWTLKLLIPLNHIESMKVTCSDSKTCKMLTDLHWFTNSATLTNNVFIDNSPPYNETNFVFSRSVINTGRNLTLQHVPWAMTWLALTVISCFFFQSCIVTFSSNCRSRRF